MDADRNPVVMNAYYVLCACGDNLREALRIAELHYKDPKEPNPQHWLRVYAVLNREGAEA